MKKSHIESIRFSKYEQIKVLHFIMVQKSHCKLRNRDFYGLREGYGSVSFIIMSKDSDKSMLFVEMSFTLKLKAKLKQEIFV